jgi:hypothetical protein
MERPESSASIPVDGDEIEPSSSEVRARPANRDVATAATAGRASVDRRAGRVRQGCAGSSRRPSGGWCRRQRFRRELPGLSESGVKRLAASMVLAATDNPFPLKDQDPVLERVGACRAAIRAFAGTANLEAWHAHVDIEATIHNKRPRRRHACCYLHSRARTVSRTDHAIRRRGSAGIGGRRVPDGRRPNGETRTRTPGTPRFSVDRRRRPGSPCKSPLVVERRQMGGIAACRRVHRCWATATASWPKLCGHAPALGDRVASGGP